MALGARGLAPLLAFGLGGFAAGAAVRQVVLATRRQGWRGLVGRANGGMIVHLGVVIIAVAFAASRAATSHEVEARSRRARPARSAATRSPTSTHARSSGAQPRRPPRCRVRVDGGKVYEPALSQYPGFGAAHRHAVGEDGPHARTCTSPSPACPRGAGRPVTLRVIVQPLVLWLWIGGGVMALGTVLAAWPGRRRRPTDPVSAPVPVEDVPEPVGRIVTDVRSDPKPRTALVTSLVIAVLVASNT